MKTYSHELATIIDGGRGNGNGKAPLTMARRALLFAGNRKGENIPMETSLPSTARRAVKPDQEIRTEDFREF